MVILWLLSLVFVPNSNRIVTKELNRFTNILLDNDLPCHVYSARVKTFQSAKLKHARKEYNTRSIYDLHDLISFRFVFYNKEDLLKFYHHNKNDNLITYYANYITSPKDNGYSALHFHYAVRECDPIKHIECQLFILEDYYHSLYGNSSKYKDYTNMYNRLT
jgi:ppGpp synthetase/RelA/SpoT-type nucleotidyltranferase